MCLSLDWNIFFKVIRKIFKDFNRRLDRFKFVISKIVGNFWSDFWGFLYVVKSRVEFVIMMIFVKMNFVVVKFD